MVSIYGSYSLWFHSRSTYTECSFFVECADNSAVRSVKMHMANILSIKGDLLKAFRDASPIDWMPLGCTNVEQRLEAAILSDISDIANANTFRPVDRGMSERLRDPQRISMTLDEKLSSICLGVCHGKRRQRSNVPSNGY